MSLRPPSTPRASLLPQGTPLARRKSTPINSAATRTDSAAHLDSLRQAVAAHDPHDYGQHEVGIAVAPAPDEIPDSAERRKAVLPGVRAAALRSSATPSRSRTPTTPANHRPKTPTGFGSSTSRFPSPLPSSSAATVNFGVGDLVSFEVVGERLEGTVRFIGAVDGKAGEWGGVELTEEYAGRGKNDGSVKGVQYFACPPQCGLFLPLAKITAKSQSRAARPPSAAGLRSSQYAAMPARDLAARRTTLSASVSEQSKSPTKRTVATPRRSLSPTKPRASLSPTKPTPPSFSTPKPTTRLARPSLGGGTIATPTTSRKSLGPTGTPLAASIKRPGSSLRQNSMMAPPEVPPIPSAYGRTRSVTPSQMSGRITPSTSGAMTRRRTSMASSVSSSVNGGAGERPTTPSLRSSSRQSFASSTSRQSHRIADDVDELRRELLESKKREEETRTLLEGSEQLGREMEDRLEDAKRMLEERDERLDELERREAKQEPPPRPANDETSDDARRLQEKIAQLEHDLDQQTQQIAKTKSEAARKSAAKEAELESLRERIALTSKEHEDERVDLNQQIDKLRNAGQALCETYEEKIAEIELARLEALELAETLQAEQQHRSSDSVTSRSGSPTFPRSISTNLSASTAYAAAIDAETAVAEADHLRSKVAQLEEQLEDARANLEHEMDTARDRRTKAGEAEQSLRDEIKQLQATIDRSTHSESRFNARLKELQVALDESQATLELERNELEVLRHDANGGNSDDLKRITQELATTKTEFAKLQAESSKNVRLVNELREDLRAAEKEIERLQKHESNQDRRGSLTPSIGGKDDMTAAKDQIVGLKSIVSTLTDENQQLVDRSKALEDDAAELRSTQQALEATVENLMNELSATPAQASASNTSPSLSTSLRQEIEQLKSELKEVQRKSERDVKALNQEVADLEALVESKVYREDELETEVEHYKALLSKHAGTPTSNANANDPSTTSKLVRDHVAADDGEGSCEMCGDDGHDLDSCPEFLGSASPTKRRSQSSNVLQHSRTTSTLLIQANGKDTESREDKQEWCDDCEEFGHSLDNCPLAAEIF
ncbi:uncharacterized protein JCM15063_001076 [Sporobolomyces koalae]|uniref:uncharacterized protein n=1 Tax=Sporobolomyces koalae TaxID=500713 RepID=UPI003173D208